MGCVGCDICSSRPVPFHTTRPAVFLQNFLQIDLVCLRVVQEASDKPRIRERTDQANIYILDLKKPVHFGGGEVGRFVLYNTTFSQRKNVPVFPDFAGNSRAQKMNKAQTKRASVTGVKHFRAYQQVVSTSSNHLSSLHCTSSLFAPTSLFASATATNRVHRHRQSMTLPWVDWECKII